MKVEVRRVDPRDQRWEVWNPAYRVYFWRRTGAEAWQSDEFELSGIDVRDALAWVDDRANEGERYTLYVVAQCDGEIGLVRIAGDDPHSGRPPPQRIGDGV